MSQVSPRATVLAGLIAARKSRVLRTAISTKAKPSKATIKDNRASGHISTKKPKNK